MMTYEAVEKMNKLHKTSKSMLIALGIVWGVGIVGIIVSAIVSITIDPDSTLFALFFIWIFSGTVYVAYGIQPKAKAAEREIRNLYKDTFLNGIFNEFFDNAKYMAEIGFTQSKVEELGLYQLGNRFESEDQLSGEYRGVRFEQSDAHIWKHTDSNGSGNDSDIDYFKGRMFIFDVPVKYSHSVKVFSKVPVVAKYDYRVRESATKRVEMESMEFNDAFTVYSEDAHDAFYILTPAMMENLLNIYRKYCRVSDYTYHNISFHFKDRRLYFAMECSTNAFDPGAFPISYPEEKKKIKKDIQVIIDLIESLDLIDKDALTEREEEPVGNFETSSWMQEDSSNDIFEEDNQKPYTGGLKLKL